MVAFAVMAGIGLATQIYSGMKQTEANVQQAEEQARFQQIELEEFLYRREKNLSLLRRDIREFNQSTISSAGAKGIDVGSSAVLQQLADNSVRAANAISSYTRETQFKANQSRYGINALNQSAKEMQAAGSLQVLGNSLSGAYSIYRSSPGTTKSVEGGKFLESRRASGTSSMSRGTASVSDSFRQGVMQESGLLGQ